MIETERLILREWQLDDYAPYAALNADDVVMHFFPKIMTQEESDAQIQRMQELILKNGWGFWAVQLKDTGQFIGMVGLNTVEPNVAIPKTPFVEIGWRLAKEYWGNGYAYEAADACLDYAFNTLDLDVVYAFTALQNKPSWRLMEKLGMINTQHKFNHPKLEKGHELERHCLYCVKKERYKQRKQI